MGRNLKEYIGIGLKGMAMGAADVVPGVSGGTIAFISGIYEELLQSISNVNLGLLKTLKQEGLKAAWKQVNGAFLASLFLGIFVSIVSLAKAIKILLENEPILLWSFFFGLVVASIIYIVKQITKWNFIAVAILILGAFLAYYITTLHPLILEDSSLLFLFFAGAIAICAMILPGISGAFILVLLGAYKPILAAVNDRDFKTILAVGLGAIVGLLSFSKILKWLFANYKNYTLAALTGFIIGSLNKIWPWKLTQSVFDKTTGEIVPFMSVSDLGSLSIFQKQINNFERYKIAMEESVLPLQYAVENQHIDSQFRIALLLAVAGFFLILWMEKLAVRKK
jgi:putative membrane protein